jgi:hypothetical protein
MGRRVVSGEEASGTGRDGGCRSDESDELNLVRLSFFSVVLISLVALKPREITTVKASLGEANCNPGLFGLFYAQCAEQCVAQCAVQYVVQYVLCIEAGRHAIRFGVLKRTESNSLSPLLTPHSSLGPRILVMHTWSGSSTRICIANTASLFDDSLCSALID